MEPALVCLLLLGVASASPIVVREERSVYGLVPGLLPHSVVAAPGLLAALGHGGLLGHGGYALPYAAVPPIPAVPSVAAIPADYDDGSYHEESPALAPALAAVAPATFPPLDAPAATPAPAPAPLAGPTLDGPVVPPLVIEGPSGTIKTGPLSTGAVSLANHPGHAPHTAVAH